MAAKQDKTATAEWDDVATRAAPAPAPLPADAFKACSKLLRTGDGDKACGKTCRDYAKTQLNRPDLPKRPPHRVEILSTPGLADELASRAQEGSGAHEWDAIHASLCLHFPE